MSFWLILAQQDTSAAVDTLTETYSHKWKAAQEMSHSSAFIQAMASHDLIFVVLTVSLIIWFVLLFFIIRTDRKVSRLEEKIQNKKDSV